MYVFCMYLIHLLATLCPEFINVKSYIGSELVSSHHHHHYETYAPNDIYPIYSKMIDVRSVLIGGLLSSFL